LGEAGKARIVFYFPDSQRQGLAVNRDAETLLKPDERAELARAMILFPESDVACSFAPAPLK